MKRKDVIKNASLQLNEFVVIDATLMNVPLSQNEVQILNDQISTLNHRLVGHSDLESRPGDDFGMAARTLQQAFAGFARQIQEAVAGKVIDQPWAEAKSWILLTKKGYRMLEKEPIGETVSAERNFSIDVTKAPSHEDIARLAYTLWEERGSGDGGAELDWFEAERRLRVQRSHVQAA